jgi:hypothetical protein
MVPRKKRKKKKDLKGKKMGRGDRDNDAHGPLLPCYALLPAGRGNKRTDMYTMERFFPNTATAQQLSRASPKAQLIKTMGSAASAAELPIGHALSLWTASMAISPWDSFDLVRPTESVQRRAGLARFRAIPVYIHI